MNKRILVLALGFLAMVGVALADEMSAFLKVTNYHDSMKRTTATLEKLFMEDQLEFTGEGRKGYIEAWKTCQSSLRYPDNSGSLHYLAVINAREALAKAIDALDTLVYDQLVKFKTPAAKALYRQVLKDLRIALSCL